VELVADAWVPEGGGRWPVLLQRLPYGRSVASTPVLPYPQWLARRGYAVVVQDVRGRGESGGEFAPFACEAADGAATIEWAARLDFCNGDVATYGFSYQGLNQLSAAALQPPSLRAIAPMMCSPDPYEGWTYEHGALRWPFVTAWAAQLASQEPGVGPIVPDLEALPIASALGPAPPVWFREWLDHPDRDDYWQGRAPDLNAISVPTFSVLGFFDDFSAGTARLIEALGAEAVCGPWAHMPWGTRLGNTELGPLASPAPVTPALVSFFDRALKGIGEPPTSPVRYLPYGSDWQDADSWPPDHEVRIFSAHSDGNANSRHGDGKLVPGPGEPLSPSTLVAEPLVAYPGAPTPLSDEGPAEDRRDVLCYTSDILMTRTIIAGNPRIRVSVRADRHGCDLVASLVVVGDNESATRLTTGVRRGTLDSEVLIELRPIAWTLQPGSRLRVDVSAARFPEFDRHPQTVRRPLAHVPRKEHQVNTLEVGRVHLELPVVTDCRCA